jgi:arylsulfatase A-like enzyme
MVGMQQGRRRRSWTVAVVTAAATVLTVAVASPTTPSAAGTTGAAAQTRPNIVVIMVDDMRDDDLRFMPATRRLVAGAGARFVNSFSPNPLCCPARASAISGLYTHNHRVFDISRPYGGFVAFDDRSTLPTWLRAAGYATIHIGKYLNGYGRMPRPGTTSGRSTRYVPPGWTDWRASLDGGLPARHPQHGGTYNFMDTTLSRDGRGFVNYQGRYQSTVYGGLTESVIRSRARSDRPFFLYVAYTAPHAGAPREPDDPRPTLLPTGVRNAWSTTARPKSVRGRFDGVVKAAPGADWVDPDPSDKPPHLRLGPLSRAERAALREVTRQRAEALRVVDRQVQRTIDALRASGELGRTVVLFTSDNGYFLGEQGVRQGQILPHEPSLRVPLLIRGPGIPAGVVRTDPFTTLDIAPTLAEAAGAVPARPLDGLSMLGVAQGGDRGWDRPILTESRPKGPLRNTDEAGGPLEEGEAADVRFAIGVRTPRYLYVDNASGWEELYDVVADPEQYHNLVTDPAHGEALARLRELLSVLRACDGAACRPPLPPGL